MMKKKKTLSLSKISIANLSNSNQIRGGNNLINTESCIPCIDETQAQTCANCTGGANTDVNMCHMGNTVTTTINGHTVGCTPPPPTDACLTNPPGSL